MDGGSTDNTMAIVQNYKKYFAHIQSGKDGGQSHAIAAGFKKATGQYMSWLNSDDTYCPNALLEVGKFLQKNPTVKYVYGNTNIIDADDRIITHRKTITAIPFVMRYAYMTVPQMSAFWSRDVYVKAGGMNTKLQFCIDFDIAVRLASISRPKWINLTIGNLRRHAATKTSNLNAIRQAEDILLQDQFCKYGPTHYPNMFRFLRLIGLTVAASLMIANGSIFVRLRDRLWRKI
jgi:glycosyltransferase involved in cell wall biosynthesis